MFVTDLHACCELCSMIWWIVITAGKRLLSITESVLWREDGIPPATTIDEDTHVALSVVPCCLLKGHHWHWCKTECLQCVCKVFWRIECKAPCAAAALLQGLRWAHTHTHQYHGEQPLIMVGGSWGLLQTHTCIINKFMIDNDWNRTYWPTPSRHTKKKLRGDATKQ